MSDPSSTYRVDFEPAGKGVEVTPDTTLLEAARQAEVALASACGGVGNCGQCRVEVRAGNVSTPTDDERVILTDLELQRGQRLACSTHVHGDAKVFIPSSSLIVTQRLQLAGDMDEMTVDPLITAHDAQVSPPTLHDTRSDLERVATAIQPDQAVNADPSVIHQMTSFARTCDWKFTAFVRDSEIIGVAPTGSQPAGLAVDLGTTKIAAALVDLTNGDELATAGALNPQIGYGGDVISRLAHVHRNPEGGHTLAVMVRKTLNSLLDELVEKAGVSRHQVADACIVGNTAMTHLLLELPVRQLAVSPYVAATDAAIDVKARDLGLTTAPGAYAHVLSCIGGFAGADHVAMILSSRLDQVDHVALGIDIGTNTEIALARPGESLTTVSCASGPAFEGAHIGDGMRAAAGAIEAIELTAHEALVTTVDDAPAIGLCGSGIIDGVAQLRHWDLINERGRFDRHHPRVRGGRHGAEFVLVPAEKSGNQRDVVITQEDVNQIQLAKGAIRAGLEVLLDATGTTPEDVEEVIIAGAFGSFLKLRSALEMGLLPRLPNARYRQVGNAALVGAWWALVSRQARARAQRIAAEAKYLELTTYPEFNRRFAMGMLFPSIKEEA